MMRYKKNRNSALLANLIAILSN